jgi:hypothetical protein
MATAIPTAAKKESGNLSKLYKGAFVDAWRKFDARKMIRNPVMFVVEAARGNSRGKWNQSPWQAPGREDFSPFQALRVRSNIEAEYWIRALPLKAAKTPLIHRPEFNPGSHCS